MFAFSVDFKCQRYMYMKVGKLIERPDESSLLINFSPGPSPVEVITPAGLGCTGTRSSRCRCKCARRKGAKKIHVRAMHFQDPKKVPPGNTSILRYVAEHPPYICQLSWLRKVCRTAHH